MKVKKEGVEKKCSALPWFILCDSCAFLNLLFKYIVVNISKCS